MFATILAETPALPLHAAGKYVAGAYIVLFAIVLIYVAIMAIRLSRIERDLGELLSLSEHTGTARPNTSPAGGPNTSPTGEQAGTGGERQDQQPESTLA
jgi:hypothetical protein